jgi:hypothetical protein
MDVLSDNIWRHIISYMLLQNNHYGNNENPDAKHICNLSTTSRYLYNIYINNLDNIKFSRCYISLDYGTANNTNVKQCTHIIPLKYNICNKHTNCNFIHPVTNLLCNANKNKNLFSDNCLNHFTMNQKYNKLETSIYLFKDRFKLEIQFGRLVVLECVKTYSDMDCREMTDYYTIYYIDNNGDTIEYATDVSDYELRNIINPQINWKLVYEYKQYHDTIKQNQLKKQSLIKIKMIK